MKIFFNYADLNPKHIESQKCNAQIARQFNIFDEVYELNKNKIDINFYKQYSHILNQPRGAGFWLWKPYFINEFLNQSNENDIIVYADSSIRIDKDITPLFEILEETQGILTFISSLGDENFNPEKTHTKKDIFVKMGCDNDYYYNGKYNCQFNGAFIIIKNNNFSKNFVKEWLELSCDEQLLTDLPSNNKNYLEFKDNRHDQSILSLLSKKNDLYPYPDPTQWGNDYRGNSKVIQFLSHLR
jgi:hypothetical protein